MPLKDSKNDKAWNALFDTYAILDSINNYGTFEISAAQINAVREARLMTKIDHAIQLPAIFKKNYLSILPNSRGTYLIGRFESYFAIPQLSEEDVEYFSFPDTIQTLDPLSIYSESSALLCADVCGMIGEILGEDAKLTVFGRMSSGTFSYRIKDCLDGSFHTINVQNSQCEIDAGFESDNYFAIIEAKTQNVSDFLVRQLYYPYRLWSGRTIKQVIPIFLTVSNDVFTFNVYRFLEEFTYNSIELVRSRKFRIAPKEITLADIEKIAEKAVIRPEPAKEGFPQADSFPRIIDLLGLIVGGEGRVSRSYITENYAFDSRQTQYYTSAACFLGLIERQKIDGHVEYTLSSEGNRIMSLRPDPRNLALADSILSFEVFNRTFKLFLQIGKRPTNAEVAEIILGTDRLRGQLSAETASRRAQTVVKWCEWILYLQS